MHSKTKLIKQRRVFLTGAILKKLIRKIYGRETSELAMEVGLPYTLIYNLIRGRINSLSVQDYHRIFGEPPPYQEPERVDGAYFRGMVRLWIFFHDKVNESDLYNEFYQEKDFRKVDYRIFTGEIKTVEVRLEEIMEQKFLDLGFERSEIQEMIQDLYSLDKPSRVPYDKIKPVADYIAEHLNISPTRILNQNVARYESGELKTVSDKIYQDALKLKKRTERSLQSGSRYGVESINEDMYGKRKGFTLFSEVEEELAFLKKYGKTGLTNYLGRSISPYQKSKIKRMASWRVKLIQQACTELIKNKPEIEIQRLPKSYLTAQIRNLSASLKTRIVSLLTTDEGNKFEKVLLESAYALYKKAKATKSENVPMEKAAYVLGMSKSAFDLLVVAHPEEFRKIGIYDKGWYLPHAYLRTLKSRKAFNRVILKYEQQSGKSGNRSLL